MEEISLISSHFNFPLIFPLYDETIASVYKNRYRKEVSYEKYEKISDYSRIRSYAWKCSSSVSSHLTALAASSGAQQSTAVTEEQAKEIAASKAGLSVSDLSFFWMEKEWDDGRLCYEGEFVYKTTEYEFEIDVNTGTITEWDTESIYD